MRKNILMPFQVNLGIRGFSKRDINDGDCTYERLLPVPLSLMQRVFGSSPGAPWFYDNHQIDDLIEKELQGYMPFDLDFHNMQYRIEVSGDGMGELSARSLRPAITSRGIESKKIEIVHVFSDSEKHSLEKLYKENRLSYSKYPYAPFVTRIDEYYVDCFIAPLGLSDILNQESATNVFFMDMIFNHA